MPFGLWIRVGTRKYVLGAVHTDATWRNHWNIHVWRQCGLFVKFLWQLVIIVSDAITRKMAEHFICRDSIKRELRWLRGRHSWICIRTSSALNKGLVKVQSEWMVATVSSLQGGKGTMQLIAERSHRRKNKCCCNRWTKMVAVLDITSNISNVAILHEKQLAGSESLLYGTIHVDNIPTTTVHSCTAMVTERHRSCLTLPQPHSSVHRCLTSC